MTTKKLLSCFFLSCLLLAGRGAAMEKTPIEQLPDDCLCTVFEYVDETDPEQKNWHFVVARFVCGNWNDAFLEKYMKDRNWRPLVLMFGWCVTAKGIKRLRSEIGEGRRVGICFSKNIFNKSIKKSTVKYIFKAFCRDIVEFNFAHFPWTIEEGVQHLLEMKDLEKLSVSRSSVFAKLLCDESNYCFFALFPNLRDLDLRGCNIKTDEEIMCVVKMLPKLQRLALSGSRLHDDYTVMRCIVSGLPDLKRLVVTEGPVLPFSYDGISVACMQEISQLSELRELQLHCGYLSDEKREALKSMKNSLPKLRRLALVNDHLEQVSLEQVELEQESVVAVNSGFGAWGRCIAAAFLICTAFCYN